MCDLNLSHFIIYFNERTLKMTRKRVQCKICSRNMRSDNLSRHIKTHGFTRINKEREISTFDGSAFGTYKPKSRETMDKLKRHVLKNNIIVETLPLKTTRIGTSLYSNNESKEKDQIVNSVLSKQPMIKEFLSRQQTDKSPNRQIETEKQYDRPTQSINNDNIPMVVLKNCIKPKSIGELWCNEDKSINTVNNSDEESSNSVDVSSEKDYSDNKEDEEELTNVVRFLPITRQDLQKRFSELFGEFMRSKKYETRNEIVFLLDEMLRRERITLSEYEKLNNILIETLDKDSLDKEKEEEDYYR